MCGVAIDVPDIIAKVPSCSAGETAAITSVPGAAMSGLIRSPPLSVDGPDDE